MDLKVGTTSIVTDFTTQPDSTNFGTENAGSVHNVKFSTTFEITSTSATGDLVINIPLDNTLEATLTTLAGLHERYAFRETMLDLQSTSPFGTASGSIQIGYIPDPTNASLSDDKAKNIAKLVRQSGSIELRPRDTKTLYAQTDGTAYCKASGDPRFWSFGAIIALVRSTPATGDSFSVTATFSCTVQYYKMTINSSTTLVRDKFPVKIVKCRPNAILFELPDFFMPDEITIRPASEVTFAIVENILGKPRTRLYSPSSMQLRRKNMNVFEYDDRFSTCFEKATSINTLYINQPFACEVEYLM